MGDCASGTSEGLHPQATILLIHPTDVLGDRRAGPSLRDRHASPPGIADHLSKTNRPGAELRETPSVLTDDSTRPHSDPILDQPTRDDEIVSSENSVHALNSLRPRTRSTTRQACLNELGWAGRRDDLLWVAPELLRLSEYPVRATKKGDVYAFAIIMFEILTRSQPFGLRSTDNPEEIILRVLNEEKPPFRPHMPEGEPEISLSKLSDYGEVLDLMMMCWDEYPLFRLPFTTVSHNLKKIRQSAGTARNLADEMLAEMTKYTDLLETQVEERTMQIQDEQEKADELLARMLPKSVTHDLKMGKTVIPESYHSVTIFFSDIVGFTALAARSTPLQVVNLLNDLYTLFDKVVDDYDAYKIETIGDAYMVVSGLPVRNGDQHAAEIASVALRILSCVLGFKIRHCPDHHLLLRIGLHTGPVVAGVVGLKMPRYCLFGDTVNYAARMESSGKPLHIHISETCKSYLDRLGDFHAKERGMMDIMGTGKTKTYFLLGKVGLHVIAETLPQEIRDKVGINVTFVDDKKMIKQQ